jgi:dihydroflavonol-4-reductase
MPRFRVPYGLAFAAAAIGEIVADYLTRKSPKAPLADVRVARRLSNWGAPRQ